MSRIEQILFALIAVVVIVGAVWVLRGWQTWRGTKSSSWLGTQVIDYNLAKQAENPLDPCAPPAGYTEESWREHMGHHPDEYKQCLGK